MDDQCDCGEAFNTVCDKIVEEGIVEKFVEYEQSIHQFLSSNDHPVHGAAKLAWRH